MWGEVDFREAKKGGGGDGGCWMPDLKVAGEDELWIDKQRGDGAGLWRDKN